MEVGPSHHVVELTEFDVPEGLLEEPMNKHSIPAMYVLISLMTCYDAKPYFVKSSCS